MKTIIIINDIPFSKYHPLLNKILHYIDFRTFDIPVTKFDQLSGLDDDKWEDYKDAVESDDFDYYIICLDLNAPYSTEEQAMLEQWLHDYTIYPVQASLLTKAFIKDATLKTFIDTPLKHLMQ